MVTDKTEVFRSVIGGRVQDNIGKNDAAINNRVDMSGSTTYEVRGGFTVYGNAVKNQVSLEKKSNATVIYGGFAKYNGDAIKNEVYLKNSEVQVIYGGYSETKGNALNNIIKLENSNVSAYCIGGYVSNGKAESNKVHLNSSTASLVFGGGYYYMQEVDALRNIVYLEDNSKVDSVYGGFTTKGKADGNEVTGYDSSISFAVYGGWGTTGASNNIVKLDNVNVSGTVTGGKTDSGTASGNEVVLSSRTTFRDTLYAGYTQLGDAIDNNLTLTDISVESQDIYSSFTENGQAGGNVTLSNSYVRNVYGAETESGAANGSTVKGTVSTIDGKVYGGHGTTGASSNTVDLDNVKVSGEVRGGKTTSGDASDNKVLLSNKTTFAGNLYAGYTENGDATGNEVSLSDVSAPQDVYASFTKKGQAGGIDDDTRSKVTITESSVTGSVYGGCTASGTASYNQVTVSGSNASIQGKVYGGYGSLDTSHNIVELSEGAYVGDDVVGGHSAGDSSTNQNVLDNKVTVSSGRRVEGSLYGGVITKGRGTVQHNIVKLNNASVGYDVVGGGVLLDAQTGIVEENHVNISAGTVEGNVYGGAFHHYYGTGNSDIRNNTVILSKGTVVTKSEISPDRPGSVYGGYNLGIGDVTGNSVSVSDSSSVDGDVYGGMVKGNDDSNPGSASQNSVRIESGSTVGGSVYGGWNSNGETSGNFIYVDGTVSGGVTAGYTLSGDAAGNEVLVRAVLFSITCTAATRHSAAPQAT